MCAPAQESLWLVFIRGGALYGINIAVESGRTAVRLDVDLPPDEIPAPGSAAWSPDGNYLTFATQRAGEADAGVADAGAGSDAGPIDAGNVEGGAADAGAIPAATAGALYALDLSGAIAGALTRLVDDDVPYAWAPDASALLISDSTRSLFLLKRAPSGFESAVQLTGRLRSAFWAHSVPYRPALALPLATWSPTSDQVAFLTDSTVSIVSTNRGSNPPPRAVPAIERSGYAWSPDGTRLLVRRGNELVLDDATGSFVFASGAGEAVWSPDSRYVAYQTGTGTSVAAPSGLRGALTAAPFSGEACWSPDASMLSVTRVGQDVTLFDVSRAATQVIPYHAVENDPTCWSPKANYLPLLTRAGMDWNFVVLDAVGVRSSFENDGGSKITEVYRSPAITYKEIFISEFASDDSAVAFVTGPNDEQELTLVTLAGAASEGRVVARGRNLRPKFSSAAGFLVYNSSDDLLEHSTTIRELYLIDLRDGKAREPQRLAPDGSSGLFSDVSWQPARGGPSN